MRLKVCKWGNSQGIRIPIEMLREISAGIGTEVEAKLVEGGIQVRPVQKIPNLSLTELLKNYPQGVRVEETDWGKPVGGEVW